MVSLICISTFRKHFINICVVFPSGDDVFVHAKSNTPSKLFELAKMVIQSLSVAALQDFEGIYSYVCNSGRDLMGKLMVSTLFWLFHYMKHLSHEK